MAIRFLSSENVEGHIDVNYSQNGITYLAVTNTNSGTAANARIQAVGESSQLDIIASSAGYTGVTGWADSGIISTDSGASGGLKLNSEAGGISFQIATSTAMFVDTNSKVGINTITPPAVLTVKDNQDSVMNAGFAVERSNNTTRGYFNMYGGALNIVAYDNTPMKFRVGASGVTTAQTILSNGNIGIGTTGPATKLDIHAGSITLDSDWPIYFGANALIEGNTSGTNLRFNATAGFKWTDGGTTNMVLLDSGDVGIGTATPSSAPGWGGTTLEISSTVPQLRLTDEDASRSDWTFAPSEALCFIEDADIRMRIKEGGDVGINIDPTHQLDVYSGTDDNVARFQSSDDGAYIQVRDNDTLGQLTVKDSIMAMGIDANYPADNMLNISSAGDVGIGTLPYAAIKLNVRGPLRTQSSNGNHSVFIEDNGSGLNYGMDLFLTNDLTSTQGATRLRSAYGGIGTAGFPNFSISRSTDDQYYGANPNTLTYSEVLVIDGDTGNVGIGTVSPGDTLTIDNDTNLLLGLNAPAGNDAQLRFYSAGNYKSIILRPASSDDLRFNTVTSGDVMTIKQSGAIGIGTTAPDKKVHIVGAAAVTGAFYDASTVLIVEDTNPYLQIIGTDGGNQASTLMLTTVPVAGSGDNKHWAVQHRGTTQSGNFGISYDTTSASGQDGGNGVDLFVIDTGGDVGIGTITPAQKLHIAGNLRVDSGYITVQPTNKIYLDGGNDTYITESSANNMAFYTASGERMAIGATGAIKLTNYGSGTFTGTSAYKLSVDSSGNVIETAIGGGAVDGSGTANTITMWTDSDTIGDSIITESGSAITVAGSVTATFGDFYAAGDGNNPILHVKDTTDTMVALFESNRAGDTGANVHIKHWPTTAAETNRTHLFFEMKDDGDNVTKYGTIGCYIDDYTGGTEDGNLRFSVMQDGDSTEMMRIDATGVGIGITNPTYKLEVKAGGDDGFRVMNSSSVMVGRIFVDGSLDGILGLATSAGTETVLIRADSSDSYISTGNFGIGTTSPGAKLEVDSGTTNTVASFVSSDAGANISLTDNSNRSSIEQNTADLIIHSDPDGAVASSQIKFMIDGATKGILASTGALRLNAYGSGTFTGTSAYKLSVDSSGNVIETAIGGGAVDGSGTANYVTKWTDSDTIGNSVMYDDGTNVGIGTDDPQTNLEISDTDAAGLTIRSVSLTGYSLINFADAGDDNVGRIYYGHDDNAMRFRTNDGERMRITSGGNVGISGTPPTNGYIASGGGWKMLQIGQSGQIAAYGTDDEIAICQNTYLNTSGVFQAITSDVAGSSIILVDGKMYFKNASTSGTAQTTSTRMFIDTDGDVGIGTTSPQGLIDLTVSQAKTVTSGSTFAQLGKTNESSAYASLQCEVKGGASAADRIWSFQTIEQGVANAGNISFQPDGGNVGIGTTSPEAYWSGATNLVVYEAGHGGITIASSSASYEGSLAFADGTSGAEGYAGLIRYNHTSNYMEFYSNGTTRMRIDSAGNVGIGTTSPAQKLHSYITTGDIYNLIETGSGVSTAGSRYKSSGQEYFAGLQYNATSAYQIYDITNSLARLTILNTGNVGIGTTTPQNILHLKSNDPKVYLEDGNAGTDEKVYVVYPAGSQYVLQTQTDAFGAGQQVYVVDRTGTTVDGQKWYINNSEALVLDSSGDVGIGTTAPVTKLHLGGTAPLDSIIRQDSTASGTNWEIGERAAGKWQIWEDDGDSVVATFMSSGNVGIGTATPSNALSVEATVASDWVAEFKQGHSTAGASYGVNIFGGTNSSDASFQACNQAGSALFRIDGDGEITASANQNATSYFVFQNTDTTNTSSRASINCIAGNRAIELQAYNDDHLYINRTASTNLYIQRAGTTDMVIDSTGDVGIGTTSPDGKFHVNSGTDNVAAYMESTDNKVYIGFKDSDTTTPPLIGGDDDDLIFNTNDILALTIDTSQDATFAGNVSLADAKQANFGGSSDMVVVHDGADGYIKENTGDLYLVNYTNDKDIKFYSDDGAGNTREYFFLDGSIAASGGLCYTTWPDDSVIAVGDDQDLKISHQGDQSYIENGTGVLNINNNAASANMSLKTTNAMSFWTDGNKILQLNASGSAAFTNSLSKGSGSFKIDHPLEDKKDTHHLIHSFIEGPQADLIYRGKVTLVDGAATINIDTAAGMTEGTFVLLNTNVQCFTSNESDWDNVKGSVSGNTLTIACENASSTATVSWMVIGERQDQHMKDTDWTDDDGKVIVEPEKET